MKFRRINMVAAAGALFLLYVCLLGSRTHIYRSHLYDHINIYRSHLYDHINVALYTSDQTLNSTITTESRSETRKHLISAYVTKQPGNESVERISEDKMRAQVTTVDIDKTETPVVDYKHRITVSFKGRLGNLMFEYASLLGIAKKNNLVPLVPRSLDLFNYFDIRTATLNSSNELRENVRKYVERKGCTFEPGVMDLGEGTDVRLKGYFQSWKYIAHVADDIRENFKWKGEVAQNAKQQLKDSVHTVNTSNVLIGVHVRRGDMSYNAHMMHYGYISADVDYLTKALNHFRSKYAGAIFVVVSDDIDWCSDNIHGDDVRFVTRKNSAAIDMAILSLCDHMVVTSGSFSWWAAWLAGGEVVYFKGYPRPNSKLSALLTPTDYRPPSWIGL